MLNTDRPIDEAELARLTDLVDAAEVDPATLAALEAEEAEDLRGALQVQALLRASPVVRPPTDFLRKTQRKLRRRTGGRMFHPVAPVSTGRFTIEVFAVIAVVVMAACWLFLHAEAGRRAPQPLQALPETAPAGAPGSSGSPAGRAGD